MKLYELIDEVKSLAGGVDSDIVARLNRVMVRVARDMGIPRLHLDVNGITTEFTLDTGTVGHDVSEVMGAYRDDAAGTPLELVSTFTANRKLPGWKNMDAGKTQFLIYDPATLGLGRATIRPVPLPEEPESYVLSVVVAPTLMDDPQDEPFDGLLPEYHELLIHFVVYQLLLIAGDQRFQEHRRIYEMLKNDAYNYAHPLTVRVRNPLYGGDA